MPKHFFWWLLTGACVVWYSTITVYVAIKGGADIKHMQALQTATYQENVADAESLAELLWQLYIFPKPVIALCQGAAIGGGV